MYHLVKSLHEVNILGDKHERYGLPIRKGNHMIYTLPIHPPPTHVGKHSSAKNVSCCILGLKNRYFEKLKTESEVLPDTDHSAQSLPPSEKGWPAILANPALTGKLSY